MIVAQRRQGHPITPHSRIGLTPSVRRRDFEEDGAADNLLRRFVNAGAVIRQTEDFRVSGLYSDVIMDVR